MPRKLNNIVKTTRSPYTITLGDGTMAVFINQDKSILLSSSAVAPAEKRPYFRSLWKTYPPTLVLHWGTTAWEIGTDDTPPGVIGVECWYSLANEFLVSDCDHPAESLSPGPAVKLRFGSSPTALCSKCGGHRLTWHSTCRWEAGPPDTSESEEL